MKIKKEFIEKLGWVLKLKSTQLMVFEKRIGTTIFTAKLEQSLNVAEIKLGVWHIIVYLDGKEYYKDKIQFNQEFAIINYLFIKN